MLIEIFARGMHNRNLWPNPPEDIINRISDTFSNTLRGGGKVTELYSIGKEITLEIPMRLTMTHGIESQLEFVCRKSIDTIFLGCC